MASHKLEVPKLGEMHVSHRILPIEQHGPSSGRTGLPTLRQVATWTEATLGYVRAISERFFTFWAYVVPTCTFHAVSPT